MEIRASTLSVGHGGRAVLSGLELRLRPGVLVGLVGPNGAGKSTLLRVLAGLSPPLAGTVRYDGRDVARIGARALARRLAFLPQLGEVNWALTAERLVALGRLPHRTAFAGPSAADRDAVARALARAGATELAGRPVSTLSGGERARVLLARALAVEAEWLMADEPVAALDPAHGLRTLALLGEEARGGRGVLLVLHDLAQAARFCDRLVLVAEGGIAGDGRPQEVLTDHALARCYGIEAARGSHEGESFLLPWRALQPGTRSRPDHAVI